MNIIKIRQFRIGILMSFVTLLTGCVSLMSDDLFVSDTKESKEFIVKGAKVFDGFEFRNGQDVWIKDGEVKAIGENIEAKSASIIDGKDKTLMPGLIDMHVHLLSAGSPPWKPTMGNMERTLSANLAMGVTSVLDMGAPLHEMDGWINETGVALPRFAYAGTMFNTPNGHPSYMIDKSVYWPLSEVFKKLLISEVEDIEEVREAVTAHIEAGVSYIKIALDEIPIGSPMLNTELLRKLVKYVNSRGLNVVAHIGTERELLKGVEAGVNLFVHGPYRSDFSDDAVEKLKASGIPIAPTNVVFDQLAKFYQGEKPFSQLDELVIDQDLKSAYENRPENIGLDLAITRWFDQVVAYREAKFETVEKMFKAGVPVYVGSDSPNVATVGGSSVHQEIALWNQHTDLSSADILAAATGKSGQWVEKTLGWKVGQLKPGYAADLVMVDGDLESNVELTQKINQIWIAGQEVVRTF